MIILLYVNNDHASDIIELSDFRRDTIGFSISMYCEFNNQNKANNLWLQILLWRSKDSLHFYLLTTIIELSDFRCDTFGFSIRTIGKIWIHSCYKVSYLWSRIFLLLELENFKVCTNSFNRNWSMQCTVKDGSDLITVNFKGRFFGFRDSARVSFQRNLMKKKPTLDFAFKVRWRIPIGKLDISCCQLI